MLASGGNLQQVIETIEPTKVMEATPSAMTETEIEPILKWWQVAGNWVMANWTWILIVVILLILVILVIRNTSKLVDKAKKK